MFITKRGARGGAAATLVVVLSVGFAMAVGSSGNARGSRTRIRTVPATESASSSTSNGESAGIRLRAQLATGWISLLDSSPNAAGAVVAGYVSTEKMLDTKTGSEPPGERPLRQDDPTDHVQRVYELPLAESRIIGYRLDGIGFVPLSSVAAVLNDPESAVRDRPLSRIVETEGSARASIEILRSIAK